MAKMLYQAVTTTASCYMTSGRESKCHCYYGEHITVLLQWKRWKAFSESKFCGMFIVVHQRIDRFNIPSFLRPKGTVFSKKYGVDLIRYTHKDTHTVVCSSKKLDGNYLMSAGWQRQLLGNKSQTWHIFEFKFMYLSSRYHPLPLPHWQPVHQVFPRSYCKVSRSLLDGELPSNTLMFFILCFSWSISSLTAWSAQMRKIDLIKMSGCKQYIFITSSLFKWDMYSWLYY